MVMKLLTSECILERRGKGRERERKERDGNKYINTVEHYNGYSK